MGSNTNDTKHDKKNLSSSSQFLIKIQHKIYLVTVSILPTEYQYSFHENSWEVLQLNSVKKDNDQHSISHKIGQIFTVTSLTQTSFFLSIKKIYNRKGTKLVCAITSKYIRNDESKLLK